MKNLKRKFITLVILASMLFTQGSVFAAESLKYYHTADKKVGYNRDYEYTTYFTKVSLGNNVAYCVDYGRRNPAQGTNLPQGRSLSQKTTNVILNGYPYKSASELGLSNDDEAYYATQLAVWTTARSESRKNALKLNLNSISPVNGMNDFYNKSAAAARRILAAAEKNTYSVKTPSLSLDGSEAKLITKNGKIIAGPYKVNGSNLKEEVKLSLENAPVSAKLSKTTANAGDQVYVEMDQTEKGSTLYINASSAGARYEGKVYETSPRDMQDYVLVEKIKINVSDKIGLKWDTLKGNINVLKVDQNNDRIKGVVFELQDMNGNKIAEGTTDDNGVVSFKNVEAGKYKLVETKAPNGYIKGDKPLEFVVEAGKTFEIEVENTKILGKLKIIKTDDLLKQPLAGVKFEILNEEKEVVDTIITDKEGIAVSCDLPLGKYTYRETEVPEDIVLDKQEYSFEIIEHQKEIVKEIVNTKIKGNLEILKLDKDTNKPLAGVKFNILDKDGNVVETIVTNEEGIAKSKELVKGEYKFVEVEAKEGYILDKKEYKFEIKNNEDLIKETVYNKIKTLPVTGNILSTNALIATVIATISVAAYIALKKYFN